MADITNLSKFLTDIADAIRSKNGDDSLIPAANFDEEILNLPSSSGSGEVKLFETVEEMQADLNSQEGDLAVVYREEIQPVTAESEFSSCIFPNEVILDEAFTDNVWSDFVAVEGSFSSSVEVAPNYFNFNGYVDGGEIRVHYESQDGITYTRTDGGEELQEFGTTIKYNPYATWKEVISEFMKISESTFEGIYKYANATLTTEYILNDKIYVFPVEFINKVDKLLELYNNRYYCTIVVDNYVEQSNRREVTNCSLYLSGSAQIFVFTTLDTGNKYVCNRRFDNDYVCKYDNGNISVNGKDAFTILVFNGYDTFYADVSHSPNSIILPAKPNKSIGELHGTIPTLNSSSGYTETSFDDIAFNQRFMYLIADTQLNAEAENVFNAEFYGKNGVEQGALTIDVSSSFNDANAEVYATIQSVYNTMITRVLTDTDKTINKKIYCIPVNQNNKPLLDTSNVTNMGSMFNNCTSLITIPLLDTSNVTTMLGMFMQCYNLITIPLLNTSNVTDMRSMFGYCTNLTTIPALDTSSVTDMAGMFGDCSALSDTSLNNILAMCANARNYTATKTLRYIGLTQEQATRCQSLSNYAAFIAAGWTTGY